MSMDNTFAAVYELQLNKLKEEINNFKDENNLWEKADGITNSAGTMVMHLLGNLNFTIGTHIAGNGYVRDREAEFSLTGIPREKLVADIDHLMMMINDTLHNIADERLDEKYGLEMFGQKSTRYYLTVLYGHLNYHLGQINYLRRILEH